MLESFAAWLGRTPLSAFVANQAWVVPTVQTVHILAITVVMGSVAIFHLRILGLVERSQSINALAARFLPPSAVAILVLAATGFLMIAGEPTRAIFRYVFWAKMTLLAFVIGLTAILLFGLKTSGVADDPSRPTPVALRLLAVLGLLIWIAIIVTGRWIGYAEGWPGSPS